MTENFFWIRGKNCKTIWMKFCGKIRILIFKKITKKMQKNWRAISKKFSEQICKKVDN